MKKKGGSSRFPVARIKKIMQADDDVGKVAQATPLLVSKAVEMFMQSLVDASVYQAQQRGSRKVQAYHLKQAVLVTDAFDFLKDIVARIPDPLNGGIEDSDQQQQHQQQQQQQLQMQNQKRRVSNLTNEGPSNLKHYDHSQNVGDGYEEYY